MLRVQPGRARIRISGPQPPRASCRERWPRTEWRSPASQAQLSQVSDCPVGRLCPTPGGRTQRSLTRRHRLGSASLAAKLRGTVLAQSTRCGPAEASLQENLSKSNLPLRSVLALAIFLSPESIPSTNLFHKNPCFRHCF